MSEPPTRALSLLPLHLEQDGTTVQAVIAPERGANVLGLSLKRREWMWAVPILERLDLPSVADRPTSYGIPILGPTPGRVGRNQSGVFTFEGREWRVEPTRHGFLRDLAWRVEERGPSHVVCSVDVRPDPAAPERVFPFELRARYEVRLHERGLGARLTLVNTSDRPQPLSAGFHPYLRCDRSGGSPLVRIPAAGQWELTEDDEPTPTGRVLPSGPSDDFGDGRALAPDEHWDHVFTELRGDGDGWATAWVESTDEVRLAGPEPPGRRTAIRTRRYLRVPLEPVGPDARPIPHLQLYTPPGRQAVCLEPLATPPDALNLAHVPAARVEPLGPGEEAIFEVVLGLDVLA